jgi:hypothetical protein
MCRIVKVAVDSIYITKLQTILLGDSSSGHLQDIDRVGIRSVRESRMSLIGKLAEQAKECW